MNELASQVSQLQNSVASKIDEGLVREDGLLLYPIRDDIPIMLIDEAIPLDGIAAAT